MRGKGGAAVFGRADKASGAEAAPELSDKAAPKLLYSTGGTATHIWQVELSCGAE